MEDQIFESVRFNIKLVLCTGFLFSSAHGQNRVGISGKISQ